MSPGQDWCLQCGAGAPGSLGTGAPAWRSGAGILIATAVLVLAAAGAGYAALSKGGTRLVAVTRTVAQAPVTPAPATTPLPATPAVPKTVLPPAAAKAVVPLPSVTPPKIPLASTTPKPASATPTATTPTTSTPAASSGGGEAQAQPLLLDTNAASTYNPSAYPASYFGDPSLAIDGETATGWTAQVDPAVAPKMAEGLVIDLKTPHKISAVEVITTTPGMSVQIYGSSAHTLPPLITDPAWSKLSVTLQVKSRHTHIKLKGTKPVRFLTLWISKAPASSVGTAQAPGHVSVNELELFQ